MQLSKKHHLYFLLKQEMNIQPTNWSILFSYFFHLLNSKIVFEPILDLSDGLSEIPQVAPSRIKQIKKSIFTVCKFSSKVNGANSWGQDSVPAVTSLGSRLSWNLKPQWSSLLWRLQHYLHITRGDFSFSQTVMKFNPKYFLYVVLKMCCSS